MLTLKGLTELMADYKPKDPDSIGDGARAAVCMIIRATGAELEMLMIQRAVHEGDLWSGHMAFPGGRVDPTDKDEFSAAIRECDEEIGVKAELLTPVGRLSKLHATSRGIKLDINVTPFIFTTDHILDFELNREVADTVWIPLSFFSDPLNRISFDGQREGVPETFTCFDYGKYRVWGMSLRFVDELVGLLAQEA